MKKIRPIMLGMLLAFSTIVIVNNLDNVVAATVRYVGGGGSPNYSTIALALADSSNGDTIQIASGTYNEQNTISVSVTIQGDPSGNRPIVGYSGSGNTPIFDIKTKDVTIQYLDVDGYATTYINAGIRSDVTATEHYNIDLIDLKVHGINNGYGIYIIRTNTQLAYPSDHIIQSCDVYDNFNGIYIESDPNPGQYGVGHIIQETEVYNHIGGFGIVVEGDRSDIRNSQVHNNGYGIKLTESDSTDIYRNSWSGAEYDMKIYENEYYGLQLQNSDLNNIDGYNSSKMVQIYENGDGSYSYIGLTGSSHNYFEYVEIYNNTGQLGIQEDYPDLCDNNHFTNCNIIDNSDESDRNFISITDGTATIIEDCTILRTTSSHSRIEIRDSDSFHIVDNDFGGTGMMIYATNCDYCYIEGESNDLCELLCCFLTNCDRSVISYCYIEPGYAQEGPGSFCVCLVSCSVVHLYDVNLDTADYGFEIVDCNDQYNKIYNNGSGDDSSIQNVDIVLSLTRSTNVQWRYFDVTNYDGDSVDIEIDESSGGIYQDIEGYGNLNVDDQSGGNWNLEP